MELINAGSASLLSAFTRFIGNVAIGLAYPAILYCGILWRSWDGDWIGAIVGAVVFMVIFGTPVLAYITYRQRYYILRISAEDAFYTIDYQYFLSLRTMRVRRDHLSFTIRRDQSTLWEYYVLRLTVEGGPRIVQYQYNFWHISEMRTLAGKLSAEGVKGGELTY